MIQMYLKSSISFDLTATPLDLSINYLFPYMALYIYMYFSLSLTRFNKKLQKKYIANTTQVTKIKGFAGIMSQYRQSVW